MFKNFICWPLKSFVFRLFVALTGIQYAGGHLKELQKAVKVIIEYMFFSKKTHFTQKVNLFIYIPAVMFDRRENVSSITYSIKFSFIKLKNWKSE